MTKDQKGTLIGLIIGALRFEANRKNKYFDEGDTFFALCFKTDEELEEIGKAAGVY